MGGQIWFERPERFRNSPFLLPCPTRSSPFSLMDQRFGGVSQSEVLSDEATRVLSTGAYAKEEVWEKGASNGAWMEFSEKSGPRLRTEM